MPGGNPHTCIIFGILMNNTNFEKEPIFVKRLPPGPPPLPLIGNFYQFEADLDEKFFEWKRKYGNVFTVWMPHPTVIISDYKLMQSHIVRDGDKFADRINPRNMIELLLGGECGLVFNDNAIWREQRRFALHALRNVGFNNSAVQNTVQEYSREIIYRWAIEGQGRKPVDLTLGLMVCVSNVIWQQTFGRTLPFDDPLFERVKDLAKEIVECMGHPVVQLMELLPIIRRFDWLFGYPIKRMVDENNKILEILDQELLLVRNHFNNDDEPKCFADAFIREMKRREEKGEALGTFTHQQLIGSCYDIWTAGFETTATTLRFAFHYMINHPEVQRRAQQEINEKIGKRAIQMEDQKQLRYCNAVLQEIDRLANILTVNFTRMVTAPVQIEGYSIPVGSGVIPEYAMVHMNPAEFERPELFCPERHLNENGEFVKDPRIAPFSIGKRSCLGEGLARMELFLYFTSFIQHLSFSSVSKIPPPLNVEVTFTRAPAPFQVLIERRD